MASFLNNKHRSKKVRPVSLCNRSPVNVFSACSRTPLQPTVDLQGHRDYRLKVDVGQVAYMHKFMHQYAHNEELFEYFTYRQNPDFENFSQ